MVAGAARLDLGDLDLVGADGGYDSYTFHTVGDDVDFGEPQPIDVTLASLMADGAPTETTRYENREVSFRVEIVAPDALALAAGEAALLAQVGVRTTLTWTPPDGYGPPTVFRVETSRAKFLFNDLDEVRSTLKRTFQLTLTCLPFARSVDPITVGAEFVADAVTIEDDCESDTGWSAAAGVAAQNPVGIAVDSSVFATGTGSVRFTPAGIVSPVLGDASATVQVVKTGLSIDATGGGYFVVRVKGEWSLNLQGWVMDAFLTTSGGGREAVSPLVGQADEAGFTRLSFVVPDASTIMAFETTVFQRTYSLTPLSAPQVWFDSIGLAENSSAPQNVMSFDVLGSMRCEGSFQVSAAAGLGDVLLYTVPDVGDGFRPDLRRWQTAGSTPSDANAINGTYMSPGTGVTPVLTAPAGMFRQGSYAVLARVRRSAAGSCTLTVSAQTKSGATSIGPVESVTSPTITLADGDYRVVRLGVIELPPLVTDPASDATVEFTITQTGTDYYIDELLVFPLEDHALTWVECGSGAPSATVASRFWIDEPSPSNPRGARLVGTDENRLDARYVLPESAGRHVLKPGRMLAYLLTSAAGGADLQVVYTPAHHSNASI